MTAGPVVHPFARDRRYESTENHWRSRCCHRRHPRACDDRRGPLRLSDLHHQGAGRARNRLSPDHCRLDQDQPVADAERHHERPDLAGAEGSRGRQQGHDRLAAGRHDACRAPGRAIRKSPSSSSPGRCSPCRCCASAIAPPRNRPTSLRPASATPTCRSIASPSSTARSPSPIRVTRWRAASTPSMPKRPSTPIARSSFRAPRVPARRR